MPRQIDFNIECLMSTAGCGQETPLALKRNEFRVLFQTLSASRPCMLVKAVTSSGKSVELPSMTQETMEELYPSQPNQLLVLSPTTIDVENMHQRCRVSSIFKIGQGVRAGDWKHYKITFASIGLAFKWYCNHGKDAFADFQGVLFDEIGDVQVDAEYAVLVQTALFVARERRLHVVPASATPHSPITPCRPARIISQ